LKVLVVTGRLAEESVKRYVSETEIDIDVVALPVSVASFITPGYAAHALKALGVRDYDLILMPGAVQGDVTPVEAVTKIPTFKGSLHAADIPLVLDLLGEVKLSKTTAASELIKDAMIRKVMAEIREVDGNWREVLKKHGGLVVGGEGHEIPVGRAFPMRVIAEIVNAPMLDTDSIRRRARYYEAEGADIIDIGIG